MTDVVCTGHIVVGMLAIFCIGSCPRFSPALGLTTPDIPTMLPILRYLHFEATPYKLKLLVSVRFCQPESIKLLFSRFLIQKFYNLILINCYIRNKPPNYADLSIIFIVFLFITYRLRHTFPKGCSYTFFCYRTIYPCCFYFYVTQNFLYLLYRKPSFQRICCKGPSKSMRMYFINI